MAAYQKPFGIKDQFSFMKSLRLFIDYFTCFASMVS